VGRTPFEVDYRNGLRDVYALSSKELNEQFNTYISVSLAGQCTGVGSSEDRGDDSELWPSWVPDFKVSSSCLLFNHPESLFSASRHQISSRYDLEVCGLAIDDGITVDTVHTISSYLPPRSIDDNYRLLDNDNLYCFLEWHEHAKRSLSQRSRWIDGQGVDVEQGLLEFAETIQARGCNHIWEQTGVSTEQYLERTKDFLAFLEDVSDLPRTSDSVRLFHAATYPSYGRRFGITHRGFMCLLPRETKPGDTIYIPHGNKVPIIIRQSEREGCWQSIGESYVHGMMQGEAWDLKDIKAGGVCLI